jgi:DNA-binding NtrC family response regulator
MVALSPVMVDVLQQLTYYAPAKTPVVLVGETGTGKTFFARLLHRLSGRDGELTEMSAGQLRPDLAESDICGHVRGAYTGAVNSRPGLFARAGAGTLLFDDFHLLHRSVQYMLLGPFDTGYYLPVGADRPLPLWCRLVVGIGEHPDILVERKRLLADLRYRLEHSIIMLPRLEERREEIASLAVLFLIQAGVRTGVSDGPMRISREAMGALEAARYPGNLRNLRGVVTRAYLHAGSSEEVRLEHLPAEMQRPLRFERRGDHATQLRAVSWALWKTGDCVGEAAKLIGANRNTVAALRAEFMARQGLGRSAVGRSGTSVSSKD